MSPDVVESENFQVAYTNETEQSSTEVTTAYSEGEIDEISVLADPAISKVGRTSSKTAVL